MLLALCWPSTYTDFIDSEAKKKKKSNQTTHLPTHYGALNPLELQEAITDPSPVGFTLKLYPSLLQLYLITKSTGQQEHKVAATSTHSTGISFYSNYLTSGKDYKKHPTPHCQYLHTKLIQGHNNNKHSTVPRTPYTQRKGILKRGKAPGDINHP